METEIKKKEQTMMCAEYLKFKDKNMKINNDRPTLNNIKIKSLNNQMVSKRENGITLIALVVTTIFCYDEFIKSSNNKGFLLQTI